MPCFTRRQALAVSLGAMIAPTWRRRAEASPGADRLVHYVYPQRYAVTHSAVVDVGQVVLSSLEIWIPVPTDRPSQQIRSLTIEPSVPVVTGVRGLASVARLYLTDELPRPGERFRLSVSYEAVCRETVMTDDAVRQREFGPYRKDRAFRRFTRPEKKIETTLPAIVKEAQRLRTRHPAPLDFARAAYQWVSERTEYRLIDGLGGAAYCLENGHGECGDYSTLFVALCRAAGVPARPVPGFWADRTDGWHCWAEFMLPSGDWIPVDPTAGDRNPNGRRHYFGRLDNRQVALCHTCDVTLPDSTAPGRTLDSLQTGAFWWYTSHSLTGERRPKVRFSVTGKKETTK